MRLFIFALFFGSTVAVAPGALGKTAEARKPVVVKKTVAVKKAAVVKKTVVVKKATPAPFPSSRKLAPAKTAQPAPLAAPGTPDYANDERELIRMPSPARLALRAEMRDRLAALDGVLQRMRDGQVVEAGQIAQVRLGVALWGSHSRLPRAAQPEQYMPPQMLTLALDGYKAASEFATVALTGDQHTATAMLPHLTGSCAQCHEAYRIR